MAVAQYPSYDMAMVLDRGTNSVHRFDAQSGTYFGQFGAGQLGNVEAMAYDRGANQVFVQHSVVTNNGASLNLLSAFNAFTGDKLAETVTPVSGRNQIFTYYRDGTMRAGLIADSSANISIRRLVVSSSGFILSPSDVNITRTGLPSGNLNVGQAAAWFGAVESSVHLSVDGGLYSIFTDNFNDDPVWDLTQTATPTMVSTGSSILTSRCANGNEYFNCVFPDISASFDDFSELRSAGRGHKYTYITGISTDGKGMVQRVNFDVAESQGGVSFGTFGEGILIDPIAIDVHAAPEPTTLAVMGLGAAALAWRRRRAKKS